MEWKPLDSITEISYCIKYVSCCRTHCNRNYFIFFLGKQHINALCMQHRPTAAAKHSVSLLLSYGPQQSSAEPIDHKILRLILQHEHKCWVNDIETNKQLLAEVVESSNTAFESNMFLLCFCVLPGSAETLFRWGRKTHHLLIAQSLSSVFAKNCESQVMFAWVSATNEDLFLRHSVCMLVIVIEKSLAIYIHYTVVLMFVEKLRHTHISSDS